MSFLYMAPCPPPFLAANEFQQHAYSRNFSKEIVLALMIICHIPEDLRTTKSTTSYHPTSTADVKTTTSSTPSNPSTSTSDVKTTPTSTPSDRPTSTSDMTPTFTGVITTPPTSAPSEKWLIPTILFGSVAGLVIISIVCLSIKKRKESCLSTQDDNDAPDGVILTKLSNKEECAGTNTIENVCGDVPIQTNNTSKEINQTNEAYTNEDKTESKDTTDDAYYTCTDVEESTCTHL